MTHDTSHHINIRKRCDEKAGPGQPNGSSQVVAHEASIGRSQVDDDDVGPLLPMRLALLRLAIRRHGKRQPIPGAQRIVAAAADKVGSESALA